MSEKQDDIASRQELILGGVGPPLEAYSRVTNPGRFAPLHDDALKILSRLSTEFDVERLEGYNLDAEFERAELARPTVRLVPIDPSAAPLTIAFTAFPALLLRCGRFLADTFPSCGCDACDESAEREGVRLHQLIEEVVRGHFRETIKIPWLGHASQRFELGTPTGSNGFSSGSTFLPKSRARSLVRGGPRSWQWAPWPARPRVNQHRASEDIAL